MDEDEQKPDMLAPEIQAARDAVGRAIADYLTLIHPGESPYVVAWAVGAEWTNAELEQTGRAGRDVIAANDQSISASAGIGAYLTHRFA
jgi:hypothetical protein